MYNPNTTIEIPNHLFVVRTSSNISHEKMAVKTGIKLTKALDFATPNFRMDEANKTNAITDANTANKSNATIDLEVIS